MKTRLAATGLLLSAGLLSTDGRKRGRGHHLLCGRRNLGP